MGVIFDIKRFAVHDGPGIRATVFLKGCPLSCWWCHNPESWSLKSQDIIREVKLNGKTFCEEVTVGQEIEAKEVITQLLKERMVMEESGGGVTFSGGEPLMQPGFLLELLKLSKEEGFHTAVDTSGYVEKTHMEQILPFTDLFLFDLKVMDSVTHKKYTGVSNGLILENLVFISTKGKKIYLRIPVVDEVNNTLEETNSIIQFLGTNKIQVQQVDLLPYHHIGKSKYERFGIKYRMRGKEQMQKADMKEIKQQFENAGYKVKIGG